MDTKIPIRGKDGKHGLRCSVCQREVYGKTVAEVNTTFNDHKCEKKHSREDVNQAATRIVREATEK